ncbi:MAG: hypothetical protein P4M08_13725 [Oligoflexia bacterium]|nr:hypothetical protein [Oligoflexia bacterium]
MASWIYVFSKFTPEALLFEALAICLLICAYTAFWILRKFKFGAAADAIPASVVKNGLNQLIGDAEALRAQLFGILVGADGSSSKNGAPIDPALLASLMAGAGNRTGVQGHAGAPDPELQKKLAALEAKMAEQEQVLTQIQTEKAKLEQDLAAAKSGGGANSAEDSKLKEKVASLEARLAEYSVIEDDLANLKRLQQENSQLKSALGKSGAAPSAAGEPAIAPAGSGASGPAAAAHLAQAPSETAVANAELGPTSAKTSATSTSSNDGPSLSMAEKSPAGLTNEPSLSPKAEEIAINPSETPLQATAESELSAVPAEAVTLESEFDAALAKKPKDSKGKATENATKQAGAATAAAETPDFESLVDSVEKSLQPADAQIQTPKPEVDAPAPAAILSEKSDEDLISEFEKMLNS